jgi:hypothetical protein
MGSLRSKDLPGLDLDPGLHCLEALPQYKGQTHPCLVPCAVLEYDQAGVARLSTISLDFDFTEAHSAARGFLAPVLGAIMLQKDRVIGCKHDTAAEFVLLHELPDLKLKAG